MIINGCEKEYYFKPCSLSDREEYKMTKIVYITSMDIMPKSCCDCDMQRWCKLSENNYSERPTECCLKEIMNVVVR